MTPEPLPLRPARTGDVPALALLWHDGWQAGHRGIVPQALADLRTLGNFTERLEAHLEDTFVCGSPDMPDAFVMLKGPEIDQFYIAHAAMGTGLAPRLMAAAEDLLRKRGVTRAHLICSVGNDRAARFYARQGWEERGVESATVSGPFTLDVIRFEKTL